MGKTGDGKSTFGNRLHGDTSINGKKGPFKSSNDCTSGKIYFAFSQYVIFIILYVEYIVTQSIQKSITKIGNDKVAIVDTPGAFDSGGSTADWEHAQDLVKYLKGCGGINVFIVICKPPRLDGTFLQMLKNLTIMLGREFWDYVVFVVTHLRINCDIDGDAGGGDEKDDEWEDIGDSDDEINDKSPQEWLREFALIVRGKFDLPATKPYCIGVENKNKNSYSMAIEEIKQYLKQEKFVCDRIKSPYDDKKV